MKHQLLLQHVKQRLVIRMLVLKVRVIVIIICLVVYGEDKDVQIKQLHVINIEVLKMNVLILLVMILNVGVIQLLEEHVEIENAKIKQLQ